MFFEQKVNRFKLKSEKKIPDKRSIHEIVCHEQKNRGTHVQWEIKIRLFRKNIFLPVPGPIQIYFLSVLRIICLSYIFKVNKNQNIHPVQGHTVNYFMPVLHKICLLRTEDL